MEQPTNQTNNLLHKKHRSLVNKIKLRTNIYVYGPTGSGKTHGIKMAAEECGLSFYKKLLGNQTSEASIIGYMDANGNYVKGIAYDAFTQGGVLCMDEIDNGNPNTTLVCNGLADREFAFPCGMRDAHPDFVLVATANTMGTGATLQYCGRNRLDAAMLNRFEYIDWGYDSDHEVKIAVAMAETTMAKLFGDNMEPKVKQTLTKQVNWLIEDIQSMRAAMDKLSITHIISPRNTLQAVNAHVAGVQKVEILKSILFKGIDNDMIKKIITEAEQIKKQKLGGKEGINFALELAIENFEQADRVLKSFGPAEVEKVKTLIEAKNKLSQYQTIKKSPTNIDVLIDNKF